MNLPTQLITDFQNANLFSIENTLKSNPSLLKNPQLLGRAVRHGNLEVVKKVHALGANDVQNALSYIVYGQKKESAEYLVAQGAETMSGNGATPIGACETLNSFALQLSIDLSKNGLPKAIGKKCLAMVLSTYSRNAWEKHECLKILANQGVEMPDNILMKFHRGDLEGLQHAIQKDKSLLTQHFSEAEIYPSELGIALGDGLHLTPLDGSTLLHLAVEYDEKDILKMLLEAGADSNIRAGKNNGHTPLFHAVVSYTHWDAEKAKMLLEYGADASAKATFEKQLRYMGDKELEKLMLFEDVTVVEYGEQFLVRAWVSEAALEIISRK